MRSIWAGAVGLSLGLSGAMAQMPNSQEAAATLGRPVPAASLGRPSALTQQAVESTFQPTVYRTPPSLGVTPVSGDSAPMLAPLVSAPGDNLQTPRPMPQAENLPPPNPTPTPSQLLGVGPTASPAPNGWGWAHGAPPIGYPACGAEGCSPYCGGGPFQGYCGGPAWLNLGAPANSYNEFAWLGADLLFVSVPGIHTPIPLAIHSTAPYVGPALPPYSVVIGQNDLISDLRLGAQLRGGLWFDQCHINGVDASAFFEGPASRDTTATATAAFPTLIRPYININTPLAGVAPIPPVPPGQINFGDIASTILVHTYSFMDGADVDYRRRILCNCGANVYFLLGFRYLHLNEELDITESGANVAGALPAVLTLSDHFGTTNDFFGGQIGFDLEKDWGPWSLESIMKIGVGSNHETVTIAGTNNFGANTGVGLFAQQSNIGTWNHSNFSVVPQFDLKLGYQMTPRLRFQMGLTFMYWSNVLQPGNQIDPIVDETLVPRPGAPAQAFAPLPSVGAHPIVPFTRSDYYMYGLTFGLTYKW